MHDEVCESLLLDADEVRLLPRGVRLAVGAEGGDVRHGSHGGCAHPGQAEQRAQECQQAHDELVHVEPRPLLQPPLLLVQDHPGWRRNRQCLVSIIIIII